MRSGCGMSTELLALLIVTDALFALLFLVALWGLLDIERNTRKENNPAPVPTEGNGDRIHPLTRKERR